MVAYHPPNIVPLYATKMQALYVPAVNAEKLVLILNNEQNKFYPLPFSEEVSSPAQSGCFFIFSSTLIYFTNVVSTP